MDCTGVAVLLTESWWPKRLFVWNLFSQHSGWRRVSYLTLVQAWSRLRTCAVQLYKRPAAHPLSWQKAGDILLPFNSNMTSTQNQGPQYPAEGGAKISKDPVTSVVAPGAGGGIATCDHRGQHWHSPSVTTVIGSQDGRLPLTKLHEYVWRRLHGPGNCLCLHGWPITDRWHWSSLLAMPWPHFALGACTCTSTVYEWLEWNRKWFFYRTDVVKTWHFFIWYYVRVTRLHRLCT